MSDTGTTCWYAALTLSERLLTPPVASSFSGRAQAVARFKRWRDSQLFARLPLFSAFMSAQRVHEALLLDLFAETPAELAARLPQPAWIRDLPRLWADQAPPATLTSDPAWGTSFLPFLGPILGQAEAWLAALPAGGPEWLPTARASLLGQLANTLHTLCARVLIVELNAARLRGELVGATGEERFGDFVRGAEVPGAWQAILERYPVLARLLLEAWRHWEERVSELRDHLAADWADLRAWAEAEPGPLASISGGLGDTHRGGKSVSVLRFGSGWQVVYKPRSLAIDSWFQSLLQALDAWGIRPHLATLPLLERGDHGWMTFIKPKPCADHAEVERFYQRQGAYLALFYVLGATDMHYENLIAAGEHPLLIDGETLLQAPLADQELGGSLLKSGMLPQRFWATREHRGVELSGLGGAAGQALPFALPTITNPGTDAMALRPALHHTTAAANRATLAGEPVDLSTQTEALCAGFRAAYDILQAHQHDVAALIDAAAELEIRVLLRATQSYAVILHGSYHPELLRDGLERERWLAYLWLGAMERPLLQHALASERADIWAGDIPWFGAKASAEAIYRSPEAPIPGCLATSAVSAAKARLALLNGQDREERCAEIAAIIAASNDKTI